MRSLFNFLQQRTEGCAAAMFAAKGVIRGQFPVVEQLGEAKKVFISLV